jgi:hypothetical protein
MRGGGERKRLGGDHTLFSRPLRKSICGTTRRHTLPHYCQRKGNLLLEGTWQARGDAHPWPLSGYCGRDDAHGVTGVTGVSGVLISAWPILCELLQFSLLLIDKLGIKSAFDRHVCFSLVISCEIRSCTELATAAAPLLKFLLPMRIRYSPSFAHRTADFCPGFCRFHAIDRHRKSA